MSPKNSDYEGGLDFGTIASGFLNLFSTKENITNNNNLLGASSSVLIPHHAEESDLLHP